MNFTPITITLPHQDWAYIVGALRKQPMEQVEAVVAEMRRQVMEQTAPKEEAEKNDGPQPA